MIELDPGLLVDALGAEIELEPVGAEQVVAGSPRTGFRALHDSDGRELGVWEMTPGAMRDTEVDEVFVVLAGRAHVVFKKAPGMSAPPASIHLAPGSVVRLSAGMQTIWTVTETLRKLYIA